MIPFYEYHQKLVDGGSIQSLDFALHMHGGPELVRVRSGLLKVQIHSHEYEVSSGHLVVIFPNIIHSYQTISAENDTELDIIFCKQDTRNGFPGKLIGSNLRNPVLPISELHPDINYLYSALHAELKNNDITNNLPVISAILQLFWLRLLPHLDIISASRMPDSPDIPTAVIAYVSEHFCEPLSLEQISKELGICRFYLSRVFTQILHIGFHEYVNALRIDYAKKLLQNTRSPILDIAIQCGFQNQQTFNRIFKSICGITPSAYRKNVNIPFV